MVNFQLEGIPDAAVRNLLSMCHPNGFVCGYVAYQHFADPTAPLIAHVGGALTILGSVLPPSVTVYQGNAPVRAQLTTLFASSIPDIGAAALRSARTFAMDTALPSYTLDGTGKSTELREHLELDPEALFFLDNVPWVYGRGERIPFPYALWRTTILAAAGGRSDSARNLPLMPAKTPRPSFVGHIDPLAVAEQRTPLGWASPILPQALLLGCAAPEARGAVSPFATWQQGSQQWDFRTASSRLGAILRQQRPALAAHRASHGVDPDIAATHRTLEALYQHAKEIPEGEAGVDTTAYDARMHEVLLGLSTKLYALCAILAYDDGYARAEWGTGLWGISAPYRHIAATVLSWHVQTARALALITPPTQAAQLQQRILRLVSYRGGARRSAIYRALSDIPLRLLEETIQGMIGITLLANTVRDDPSDLHYTRKDARKGSAAAAEEGEAPAAPPTAHAQGVVLTPETGAPAPQQPPMCEGDWEDDSY